jgi:hypothetical protein
MCVERFLCMCKMSIVPSSKNFCCGCDLKCVGVILGIVFLLLGVISIVQGASNISRDTHNTSPITIYPLIIDGVLFIIEGILTFVMACQDRKNSCLAGFMYYYSAFKFILYTILSIMLLIIIIVSIRDLEDDSSKKALIIIVFAVIVSFFLNLFIVRYFYVFYRIALRCDKGENENMDSPYSNSGREHNANEKGYINPNSELVHVRDLSGRS